MQDGYGYRNTLQIWKTFCPSLQTVVTWTCLILPYTYIIDLVQNRKRFFSFHFYITVLLVSCCQDITCSTLCPQYHYCWLCTKDFLIYRELFFWFKDFKTIKFSYICHLCIPACIFSKIPLIWPAPDWTGAGILNIPYYPTVPTLTEVLTCNFFGAAPRIWAVQLIWEVFHLTISICLVRVIRVLLCVF